MLQETKIRIEHLSKPLADLDITQPGSWVGVTDFSDVEQSLFFADTQIKLPEKIRFPVIRSIDENRVLVADTRIQKDYEIIESNSTNTTLKTTLLNENNAWIITSTGEIKANFSADDAIQDIIITKDFIVVTQFDEAAIGGDGVCIYNFEGKRLFSYYDLFGEKSVTIYDCYAATLVKENQIIFCPYNEFPLVLFDIETKTQQVWKTPSEVGGSGAITQLAGKIYFHSPYNDKTAIYEWQIGSERAEKIGEYSNYLRGLPDGKFLAKGDLGYTIISLQ